MVKKVKELKGYPKGFMAIKDLPDLLEKRMCRDCNYPEMYRIEGCILYDKYYLCPHCGLCDFSSSRKLTPKENTKKLRLIAEGMGITE